MNTFKDLRIIFVLLSCISREFMFITCYLSCEAEKIGQGTKIELVRKDEIPTSSILIYFQTFLTFLNAISMDSSNIQLCQLSNQLWLHLLALYKSWHQRTSTVREMGNAFPHTRTSFLLLKGSSLNHWWHVHHSKAFNLINFIIKFKEFIIKSGK
jgi:hypothetical protein